MRNGWGSEGQIDLGLPKFPFQRRPAAGPSNFVRESGLPVTKSADKLIVFKPIRVEVGSFEMRSPEGGSFEMRSPEIGFFEMGVQEEGSIETRSTEVGSFETCSPEVGSFETRSPEIGSFEMR